MARTKLGLLSFSVSMLGLMMLNVAAQAAGTWLILDGKGGVKTGAELAAVVQLEKDSSTFILHAEILKIKVLFLCTELKAVNAKIFGEGAIGKGPGEEKGSQVLFSGCTTDLNGSASPECTPKDPTDGEGFIVTKLGHGLVSLHELETGVKDDIVILLPDEGETFATVTLPGACPIGTSIPVIGKLALKDCENLALTHLVKHLFEAFNPLSELWVVSKTTEHKTTVSGSAWGKLGGEHVGLQYSISNL